MQPLLTAGARRSSQASRPVPQRGSGHQVSLGLSPEPGFSRRALLIAAVVCGLPALLRPGRAEGLGGTLPSLEVPAPGFELDGILPTTTPSGAATAATRLSQESFAGRWLVVYFYPKDFTSGCTLEARGFQRDLERFHQRGAEIVGISADRPDSHASFCSSEGLAYPLLSDPGGTVSRAWGSWLPPFSLRHTFLVDPQGILRARWSAVQPAGHSDEVLSELIRLQSSG